MAAKNLKDGALDKVKAELDALKNGNPDIAKMQIVL